MNMYSNKGNTIASVFAVMLSITAAYLPDFIAAYVSGIEDKGPAKLILTLAVILVIVIIWSWITSRWMKFSWLRKWSRIHSLEGVWIELLYKNEHPITCAIIKFGNQGEIIYQGDNYSLEGARVAHFHCDHTELIHSGRRLIFEFAGRVFKSANTLDDVQMTKGEGSIMFIDDRGKEYSRGEGQYTEIGTDKVQYFEIRKLPRDYAGVSPYEPATVAAEYMSSPVFKEFIKNHPSKLEVNKSDANADQKTHK